MTSRSGEKAGWTFGWIGAFLWVAILAGIFLVQEKTVEGLLGLGLTVLGAVFVVLFAPWRHRETRYMLLMLPLYLVFFASAAWAVNAFGGWRESGLSGWQAALVFPFLLPVFIIGRRRWIDGGPGSAGNEATKDK